ncbi:carboxypeptidase regulatory-like domain-containing protein [Roseisolibacter sp. H3M3-2]|uniref:carboxypeptidase-like regulatory domain-containing protein n=1 Tax=Roseisolibacter sp. H3M3-2 TaxID=3031323 RepID=UPI0023D9B8B2|nr:carboxypeptidase regulatory-like domain-containing protein [Roseisolibacter sp. H3M3-2]MDF1503497.1 carboxypeptidase regulatory-like domain-containing protein [Roseisolibacter sp. H3M3-2]
MTRRALPLLAAALALPAAARAQAPAVSGVVRVRVVDSTGAPVADAGVQLVRGVSEVLAAGATDAAGWRTLAATAPPGPLQLVVRRIGHLRADRFVTWAGGDTLSVRVTLFPVAQALAAVTVTERESIRRRRMSIDAEAIAASRRPVVDALDVVTGLRPDMIYGVGGAYAACGSVRHVWVNGKRQRMVAVDPSLVPDVRMGRRAQRATPRLAPQGRRAIPLDVQTMLRSIRPEHVAEMHGTDCRDATMARASSESAIFVVLKPGVGFRPGVGSYVAAETVAAADSAEGLTNLPLLAAPAPAASAPAGAEPVDRLPAYRMRVLGVYDEATGAPVDGAAVVAVTTGLRTLTSVTGTAVLAVLPDGGGTVRVERAGYRSREVPVAISPADTLPITLLLAKAPPGAP